MNNKTACTRIFGESSPIWNQYTENFTSEEFFRITYHSFWMREKISDKITAINFIKLCIQQVKVISKLIKCIDCSSDHFIVVTRIKIFTSWDYYILCVPCFSITDIKSLRKSLKSRKKYHNIQKVLVLCHQYTFFLHTWRGKEPQWNTSKSEGEHFSN